MVQVLVSLARPITRMARQNDFVRLGQWPLCYSVRVRSGACMRMRHSTHQRGHLAAPSGQLQPCQWQPMNPRCLAWHGVQQIFDLESGTNRLTPKRECLRAATDRQRGCPASVCAGSALFQHSKHSKHFLPAWCMCCSNMPRCMHVLQQPQQDACSACTQYVCCGGT